MTSTMVSEPLRSAVSVVSGVRVDLGRGRAGLLGSAHSGSADQRAGALLQKSSPIGPRQSSPLRIRVDRSEGQTIRDVDDGCQDKRSHVPHSKGQTNKPLLSHLRLGMVSGGPLHEVVVRDASLSRSS